MIQLVLFDIDGTLLRTGGAGEQAFERTCETEFGVRNGTAQLHFAGRTDASIVRDFFGTHRIEPSPANFQRFFDRYVFWLDYLLGQIPGRVLPGVVGLLDDLQALPQPPLLGLLTGNIRLGAQIKLRRFNLWRYFRTGAFGDDHEDRNHLAAIARDRGSRALKQTLTGDQILVVGDTPRDIACGHAIGARVLAVATGPYRRDELHAHQPAWAVDHLEQVTASGLCRNGV